MTRFRHGLRAIALLAALCAPGTSAAQLPARLGTTARDTLQRLIDSARAVGLPGEPLVSKVSEGVLKEVDDAVIIRVVRNLVRELAKARGALPATASAGTLSAAASAIHAGVSPESVRQLVEAGKGASEGDLGIALVTLADLVASRVPGDMAVTSVRELLVRRAPESELTALRSSVAQDILAGTSPAAAIASRTQAIVRTLDRRPDGAPRSSPDGRP
jgi:hypothetical protein